jgi:hypothetical protein
VRLPPLFLIVVVMATAAGCAKAQARTEPAMPVLAPPPPPPRLVETYIDEPVPTIEPSPGDSALLTPPSRPPVKPPVARPEPAKPEPEPVRVIEPERPSSSTPALTLKPAPGGEGKTEASIRALIGRASRDLQRVNYAALDADGRTQFDTARRFMQQAEDALKAESLAFAGKLADKAATMAAVLVR